MTAKKAPPLKHPHPLVKLRESLGLSQAKFAETVGITKSFLGKVEQRGGALPLEMSEGIIKVHKAFIPPGHYDPNIPTLFPVEANGHQWTKARTRFEEKKSLCLFAQTFEHCDNIATTIDYLQNKPTRPQSISHHLSIQIIPDSMGFTPFTGDSPKRLVNEKTGDTSQDSIEEVIDDLAESVTRTVLSDALLSNTLNYHTLMMKKYPKTVQRRIVALQEIVEDRIDQSFPVETLGELERGMKKLVAQLNGLYPGLPSDILNPSWQPNAILDEIICEGFEKTTSELLNNSSVTAATWLDSYQYVENRILERPHRVFEIDLSSS